MMNTEIYRSPYWERLCILQNYFIDFPYESESTAAFIMAPESYALALDSLVKPGFTPIDFKSNRWDFRQLNSERNSAHMVFIFDCKNSLLNTMLKMFAVYQLLNPSGTSSSNKSVDLPGGISTTNNHVRRIKRIMDRLCEKKGSILLVTTEDIITEIKQHERTTIRTRDIYLSHVLFYSFLFTNYVKPFPVTIKQLSILHGKENKYLERIADERKTPDFSNELFVKIVEKAKEVLDSPNESFNSRMTSGGILLTTQLGLRPGEITKMKTNALHYDNVPGITESIPMIDYPSEKISRNNGRLRTKSGFGYPLAVYAYQKMLEIRKECSLSSTHDYLYCLTPHKKTRRRYPLQARQFYDEYFRWYYIYLPDLIIQPQQNIKPKKAPTRIENWHEKIFYYPTFTQFRVHMTTYLRNRGIDPWNAEYNVGHQSPEMYGYYAREEDKYFKRDLRATEEFISEVVKNNHRPIGVNSSDLVQEIKQLLREARIEVTNSNLHDIVDATSGRLFIRAHNGGFGYCVRLVATSCLLDSGTNDYRCAYGLCDNQYHFFWVADASYQAFTKMQEVYLEDLKMGKEIAANKELKAIKKFLTRRLIVEIEQLEVEIEAKGIETIVKERPNLKNTIDNLITIKKEIEQWMNK